MRNFKYTLLLSFLLAFLFQPNIYVRSATDQFVKVNVNILNVRSGPGTNYNQVGKVYLGETYPIINESNSWVKVKLKDGSTGWLAGWFTEKLTSSSPSYSRAAESTVTNLNVRKGPSTSFTVIGQIHPETRYPIIAEEGDWIKIQLNTNKLGWVASWLVSITENSPSQETLQHDMVTIQVDRLNVRKGPSTDNLILGILTKGDQVEVIDVDQGWYKIEFKDNYGWIASKYSSKSDTVTASETKEEKKKEVIVSVDTLNLRSGPGLDNNIVDQLHKNDILSVVEADGDWIKVVKLSDSTVKGWVASWLVEDYNNQISNSPTVTILYPSTNIRRGPSTSNEIVTRANTGDTFPILSTEGDWYKIQLPNGESAYVAGWIVSAKGINKPIEHGIDKILKDKIIVIDAGHGGIDRGATGLNFNTIEKDLNLSVAKILEEKLIAAGATVVMTRTTDIKIPLQERIDIGLTNNADAFVSIHHNINMNPTVNGTITYYYDEQDKVLANAIQSELIKNTQLKDLNSRYGEYFILRENPRPAIITELAFISNYQDELRARSSRFQDKAADGIFEGLIKYFNKIK